MPYQDFARMADRPSVTLLKESFCNATVITTRYLTWMEVFGKDLPQIQFQLIQWNTAKVNWKFFTAKSMEECDT